MTTTHIRKKVFDNDLNGTSDNIRHLHKLDTSQLQGERFRVLADQCREYHKRHCDYSIRTNPDPSRPYDDGYGELYKGSEYAHPASKTLVCCYDKCKKVYDRDYIRCHEGYVFHRKVNEMIVAVGDTGYYRCFPNCKPVEYCENCDRRHS
jgi:hypothetical protein